MYLVTLVDRINRRLSIVKSITVITDICNWTYHHYNVAFRSGTCAQNCLQGLLLAI